MAVAYGTNSQPGLLSQQYAPPLLPKPGKDNIRLQKLLKRTAKKKAAAQASQSTTPFRSSLSPVNEASPDLERSDHSTSPRTPETLSSLYSIQHPPRFTVRPLYQHVASPYPQRAAYGRAAKMSPPTAVIPSYSYSQHVTAYSSYTAFDSHSGVSTFIGHFSQPVVSKTSQSSSVVSGITVLAAELKKSELGTISESHTCVRSATTKPKSPGPTPYPEPVGQAVIRPLTVLSSLTKSKSPRPTFKATEPSKSPKSMFDVPQIRMYTASTSYYETSRTPPVHDSAGLTAIGGTVAQSKTFAETKQDLTQPSEVRRSITTTQPPSLGTVSQRKTSTSGSKKGTALITEIQISTSEIINTTQAVEIKSVTPIPELPLSRTSLGRPKTPAYHVVRVTTPVFEISRPNPLLFAVSPITVEPERSRTPKTISSVSSHPEDTVNVTKLPEVLPNGEIHSDIPPTDKVIQQQAFTKSEPDLTSGMILTAPVGSKRSNTPTYGPPTPAVTGYQRPKTPTYEASRLMTISPGYKRPKTPTHGTSASVLLEVSLQKPMTPISQKSKSAYRGLTPAEYAAYGGIKTHSPAFGISSSVTPTHDEVKAEQKITEDSSQEPSVREESTVEVSTVKETSKEVDETHQGFQKIGGNSSVPIIIVSQSSKSLESMLTKEKRSASCQLEEKQDIAVSEELKYPAAAAAAAAAGTNSEKQKGETQIQEVKIPEIKCPLPEDSKQGPLKAVKKLLGKDKVQTAEKNAMTEKKADALLLQESLKPFSAAAIKPEGSKPGFAAPVLLAKVLTAEPRTADKGKDKKTETVSAGKKDSDEAFQATEPLLKVIQKSKVVKSKVSGWSRLKKHMVVEQEEPTFPETDSQKEVTGQNQSEKKMLEENLRDKPSVKNEQQIKDIPKATKMWDAVLFQMFSSKENIMHQIELNKSVKEMEKEVATNELKEIPSFAYRLPVLLFSPKFDAKKLKEAASRPVTKISTVFEMGLIGRKGKDEEPKDFNRTARGFTAT